MQNKRHGMTRLYAELIQQSIQAYPEAAETSERINQSRRPIDAGN